MPDAGGRVLAVIPHPDDESYAMAGALHGAVRAGARVEVLCATRGERGADHSDADEAGGSDGLARRRSAELAASCVAIGARPPRFLDLPDGALAALAPGQLEGRLADALAGARPDVVLALGRDGAYGHADHIALTEALLAVVGSAKATPRVLLAAFAPGLFVPQWRRMSEGGDADLVADEPPPLGVAEPDLCLAVDVEVKRAAIGAHRSQLPGGRPESLFPAGIVPALLEGECFTLAGGPSLPREAGSVLAGLL